METLIYLEENYKPGAVDLRQQWLYEQVKQQEKFIANSRTRYMMLTPTSYATLEGYMNARIASKRAWSGPATGVTRQKKTTTSAPEIPFVKFMGNQTFKGPVTLQLPA